MPFSELLQTGKDEIWLKSKIKTTYNVDAEDILLGTIDDNHNVKVFLYQ